MAGADVAIAAWTLPGLAPGILAQVETIFFEASGRSFEPGPERDAFRERWLGRYREAGDLVFLALAGPQTVAGYLVGAVRNPAEEGRFADISYFRDQFAALCPRFPAHLHINLAPQFRDKGIGGRLIEAFAADATRAGARGMHVVTAGAARNVAFYVRCGFEAQATALWNGRSIVFLGRSLDPAGR